MKKQLTVFAAAALVASFASAALAATPTISLTGNFNYGVEYNVVSQTWTNTADSYLDYENTDSVLSVSVTTAGEANVGTFSMNLWVDGAVQSTVKPTLTLAGPFYGGTLKLGQVAGNWDGITGGTDGAGVEYVKTFDALSLDLVSSNRKNDGLNTDTATNDSYNNPVGNAAAVRVGYALSDTNGIYGGFAATPDWVGTAFAGGKFVLGDATVEGKFATELKDDKGTGFWANATLQATEDLKLTGTFVQAESKYANAKFADFGDTAPVDHEWNKIGWAAINPAFADGANIRLRADLVAVKDVANVYAVYKSWANDTWAVVAGTNYAPLSITKAEVTMDSAENTTIVADFAKKVGNIDLSASAGYKMYKNASLQDATDNYGFVKAAKSFAWLSTWASVGKHAFGEKTTAKIGASASCSF